MVHTAVLADVHGGKVKSEQFYFVDKTIYLFHKQTVVLFLDGLLDFNEFF